jgi:hypothetical protein
MTPRLATSASVENVKKPAALPCAFDLVSGCDHHTFSDERLPLVDALSAAAPLATRGSIGFGTDSTSTHIQGWF